MANKKELHMRYRLASVRMDEAELAVQATASNTPERKAALEDFKKAVRDLSDLDKLLFPHLQQ